MKKIESVLALTIMFLCVFHVGCATTPTSLKAEDLDVIHNIAIVINPVQKEYSVLDHTGIWGR